MKESKEMKVIKLLKNEFREWYGLLSVEEIMKNKDLIRAIEQTEKVMTSLEINYSNE